MWPRRASRQARALDAERAIERPSRGAHRLGEGRKQAERERCRGRPMWNLYQTDPGATGGGPLAIGRGWPRVAPYRSKLETRCGGIPHEQLCKSSQPLNMVLSTPRAHRDCPMQRELLLAPVARPFEATALPSPSTTARIVFLS
jgi:hypothetical protein